MIVSKLQQNLIELSNDWSVISVTGPRQSGKKYNKRGNTLAGRGYIPNRIDIEEDLQLLI